MSAEEASELIRKIRAGDERSKNKGKESPENIRGPQAVMSVSLSNIPPEVIDLLKESTSPERVAAYKDAKIDDPVVLVPRRKSKGFGVSDGGHRILAALARGDKEIKAILPADAIGRLER